METVLSYFQNLLSKLKGGSIHILACILVVLLAGPEIVLAMELSAMMEAMGASTFLLVHWYAFLAYIEPLLKKFKKFEGGHFFVPSVKDVVSYPYLIIHALPDRSVVLLVCMFLYSCIGFLVFNAIM